MVAARSGFKFVFSIVPFRAPDKYISHTSPVRVLHSLIYIYNKVKLGSSFYLSIQY